MRFRIRLRALRLPVVIGWEAAEREAPQMVRFDVDIMLAGVPEAGRTDELDGTVDYGRVAEVIRSVAARGGFRLLERLAVAVRDELAPLIPPGGRLRLRVTKERPPIPDLAGGASVVISE